MSSAPGPVPSAHPSVDQLCNFGSLREIPLDGDVKTFEGKEAYGATLTSVALQLQQILNVRVDLLLACHIKVFFQHE